MDKNDELFKNTSFADLMSDVYHNSKKKDRTINQLIGQLQPLIRNASDATVIVPLIKEYLDVSVRNDDHLVKLTAIAQRYISTKQVITGADSLLSDEEKDQLLKLAENTLADEITEQIKTVKEIHEDAILHQKLVDAKAKLAEKGE
jgi:hypothetical protein